jgi:hypothetical protein
MRNGALVSPPFPAQLHLGWWMTIRSPAYPEAGAEPRDWVVALACQLTSAPWPWTIMVHDDMIMVCTFDLYVAAQFTNGLLGVLNSAIFFANPAVRKHLLQVL